MTIKAIETRYAGHLFRSRLEARWAYFFDLCKMRWEYEPQGFECRTRLSDLRYATFPYLPDFWLPDFEVYAEVKGQLAVEADLVRLLDSAAHMSSAGGGGCQDEGGHDVVLLGPITRDFNAPYGLHMHKGDLNAYVWTGQSNRFCASSRGADYFSIATDYGGGDWAGICNAEGMPGLPFTSRKNWRAVANALLSGYGPVPGMKEAMMAASQARFEHGATPR